MKEIIEDEHQEGEQMQIMTPTALPHGRILLWERRMPHGKSYP
jgi:hypothetical protein